MKWITWLLIASMFTAVTVNAQKVNVTPQLGGSIIPMNTDALGPKYGAGLHAGVDVQYQIKSKLKLTTGLYFSQKQQYAKREEITSFVETLESLLLLFGSAGLPLDSLVESTGLNLDTKTITRSMITQNNLELPFMLTYGKNKWHFHGGGYAGITLSAKHKTEIYSETPFLKVVDISTFDTTGFLQFLIPPAESTKTVTSNGTDGLQKYDAGILMGIGYQDTRWGFNVYYSHGLVDYRSVSTEPKQVHRAIRMALGYTIGVRKEEGKIIFE